MINKELRMISRRLWNYRKALDEIKSICLKDVHTFADGTELRYNSIDDILDIINTVTGEGNEKN